MVSINNILKFNLFHRNLLSEISPWFFRKECILITGSRQVGKTSLLYLIIQKLFSNKIISEDNCVFLDMEDPNDLMILNNEHPKKILDYLELNGFKWNDTNKLYMFIDEIHLLNNPSKFIKLFIDHHKDVKIFITGSASTEIRSKFKDGLPGRKIEFHLTGLSFYEYLIFNNLNNLANSLTTDMDEIFNNKPLSENLVEVHLEKLIHHFYNYLIYGGYPDISTITEADIKKSKLASIFNDYIRKDISSLFLVEHLTNFTLLFRILAEQISNILTINNISMDCSLDNRTIRRYIEILENTFIIKLLNPYNKKIKKRLIKSPKIFFSDTGMRNCALQNYLLPARRTDTGSLIENYIFNYLFNKTDDTPIPDLSFWRTSNGTEVDFIFKDIAIEVKSGDYFKNPPRAFIECMDALKLNKGIIFNKSRYEKISVNGKTIVFYPYMFLG